MGIAPDSDSSRFWSRINLILCVCVCGCGSQSMHLQVSDVRNEKKLCCDLWGMEKGRRESFFRPIPESAPRWFYQVRGTRFFFCLCLYSKHMNTINQSHTMRCIFVDFCLRLHRTVDNPTLNKPAIIIDAQFLSSTLANAKKLNSFIFVSERKQK